MASVNLFLSAVSAEFRSYRDLLRSQLQRPNVTVPMQEDFIPTGTETLDKLDAYIKDCNAVLHVAGDSGAAPAVTKCFDRDRTTSVILHAVGSLPRGILRQLKGQPHPPNA